MPLRPAATGTFAAERRHPCTPARAWRPGALGVRTDRERGLAGPLRGRTGPFRAPAAPHRTGSL